MTKRFFKPSVAFAASFLIGAQMAHASVTVCVATVADFQTELNNATGRTTTTFIKVARGMYDASAASGNGLILFAAAADQGQIDVTGGYNGDCSAQIKNPALTILDGAAAVNVLHLYSAGGLSVRYLTIQNGLLTSAPGNSSPGLFVGSVNAGVIVDYNIIRNNAGVDDAGLQAVVFPTSTSALHVDGNLIVGNSAQNQDGAGDIVNDGTGDVFITNNTIANNISQRTDAGALGGLSVGSGPGSVTLTNNIFWGNTTADLYLAGGPVLIDNDYAALAEGSGSPGAGSSGNLAYVPLFVSATDFRLQSTSTLLGEGTLTPAGGLPTIDIRGLPRSFDNLVDMGAYEYGDEIFVDSFDD